MSKSTSGLHDPYEDQLAAARYRADRDALAQAMQRVADSMREHALGVEGMGDSPVSGWERELRAALGGLESIGTMIEYRRVLNGVCKRLGLTDGTGMPEQDGVIYEALGRRLMPEGCEWPRYESGEKVELGCQIATSNGGGEVCGIEFNECGICVLSTEGVNGEEQVILDTENGERVKRPTVLASDDDGCCDPGTYRCQEAAFTCDSCGHTVFVDKCMVEEIRYLRAKGIRTLNCCCGHDGKAEPFIIVNEGDECRMLNMGYERHVNEHGVTYFTPKSSCPTKVLAADGEPLEVGQTVYHIESGDEFTVTSVDAKSGEANLRWGYDFESKTGSCAAKLLTHQRPVLDANGVPIKMGDTVWGVESGTEFDVLDVYGVAVDDDFPDHTVRCRRAGAEDYESTMCVPSRLTHQRPVLDADGVPIREDERVFGINGGLYRVTSAHDGKVFARYVNGPFGAEVESAGGEGLYRLRADRLTHTKPDLPDSAERIADEIDRLREEVALHLGDYLYDEDGNDSIQFSMELVAKRCRALAERERGE